MPIWLAHYGRQVGTENCIVLDHGSDDGSTEQIGKATRLKIPRKKFDDHSRARLISGIVSSLLVSFDAVIYSDCDELLVAAPMKYKNLVDYCSALEGPAGTAIGLNVLHRLDFEEPLDPRQSIGSQRTHVQFVSPMCKTLVTREPIVWGGGFHSSSHPIGFGDLYLFHLRWLDLGECLRRLSITRKVAFADDRAAPHHRATYLSVVKRFEDVATQTIAHDFELEPYLKKTLSAVRRNAHGLYEIGADIRSPVLHVIPSCFAQCL